MSNLLPLTPVTLSQCLNELAPLHNIVLKPSETMAWFIDHNGQITVEQARILVKQYHLENRKAFLQIGKYNEPGGIYGQGLDRSRWCLFYISSL